MRIYFGSYANGHIRIKKCVVNLLLAIIKEKKRCKGVFENVTVEYCGERNRLKCCVNLQSAQESDGGE